MLETLLRNAAFIKLGTNIEIYVVNTNTEYPEVRIDYEDSLRSSKTYCLLRSSGLALKRSSGGNARQDLPSGLYREMGQHIPPYNGRLGAFAPSLNLPRSKYNVSEGLDSKDLSGWTIVLSTFCANYRGTL